MDLKLEYKNVTEQELMSSGYERYNLGDVKKGCKILFQKKANGYFIDAELHESEDPERSSYNFYFVWQAYFELTNGSIFQVRCNPPLATAENIELFFDEVFTKMNCVANT